MFIFSACSDGTEKFVTKTTPRCRDYDYDPLKLETDGEFIGAADAKNRDKPEILSETNLLSAAAYISSATKCGKFLCGINESVFAAYDAKTFEKVWESSSFIDTSYYYKIVTNSSYAYIYNNGSVKIIKFSEDGRFEELGIFQLAESFYSDNIAVSENNVIALGKTDKNQIILSLFDMNDPENGIKTETFNFNYQTLAYERSLFTGGSTFWESGCELKTRNNTKGDSYYCYAFPFDASDPKNPKTGEKINIPGELAGVSDDGNYLYTLTPEFDKNKCVDDDIVYDASSSEYELYILKLSDSKTSVEVVTQETLADFSHMPFDSGVTLNYIYVKNDTVFIVETSTDDRTERDDEVRILSADTGKEIYNRMFETRISPLMSLTEVSSFQLLTAGHTFLRTARKNRAAMTFHRFPKPDSCLSTKRSALRQTLKGSCLWM